MFPALERLTLKAERSVWLAFRVFDPDTKLRSEEATALGLARWSDLIRHTIRRGIEVRILLSDFEPVLADHLHAGSWHTYLGIRAILETLPEGERSRLQLIVIQHEGELGHVWRHVLRFAVRRRIRTVVEKFIGGDRFDDGGLLTRPGLWPHVRWEGDTVAGYRRAPPPRLWPATYHQKFAVVDGLQAVIGGIDLDERRWDDRRHSQRADQTWHDVSALIEGPVAADAAHHFAFLWNREVPRYRAIGAEWTVNGDRELMLDPLDQASLPAPEPASPGAATVQLVRTVSVNSASWFATGPRRAVRELMAAHRAVIGRARERLYIEAQFFRSDAAADWIKAALRSNPRLEVIVLVANTPEEIAFEGQGDNPAHRHGEYLQARALSRLLRKAGPERIGLFTLAKHERVKGSEHKFEESRGTAYDAGLIHIHSKLLIADDALCLLSSANINGRSFNWDTELGSLWAEEGGAIAAFRRSLWAQLFAGGPPQDLAGWRDIARANAGTTPEKRQGFVVPYQLGRARRYGRRFFFVPDDLV